MRTIVLLCASLLLAGCFEILEEVWINADGSARIRIDIGMSEAIFSMGKGEKGEDPLGDVDKDFRETKASIERHPSIRHVNAREYSDGGMRHFVFDVEVSDAAILNDLQKAIYLGEMDTAKKSGEDKVKPMEGAELYVGRQSDGTIVFVRRFGKGGVEISDSAAEAAEAMGAMFGNYYYTVRLHAENIVSSNGKIDESGKTVEWRVPIGQLMAGKDFRKVLRAEMRPAGMGWVAWAAAGLLAVGIVVGIVVAVRKKRAVG